MMWWPGFLFRTKKRITLKQNFLFLVGFYKVLHCCRSSFSKLLQIFIQIKGRVLSGVCFHTNAKSILNILSLNQWSRALLLLFRFRSLPINSSYHPKSTTNKRQIHIFAVSSIKNWGISWWTCWWIKPF